MLSLKVWNKFERYFMSNLKMNGERSPFGVNDETQQTQMGDRGENRYLPTVKDL